jgi:hypothetical protein
MQGDPAKQQRYQNWLLAENGLASVWKTAERPSAEVVDLFLFVLG